MKKILSYFKKKMKAFFFFLKGGELHMVDLYVVMIQRGLRTIDTIPTQQKEAVRETLKAIGLDETGKPLE